jgi:glycerol-3-phosphate acyltransferase PlsY
MLRVLALLAVLVVAFLLGSVPWGIIISRLFYRTDIRKHGSGNIGTTNALRTLGKRGGGSVFLLDFGKGLLAGAVALFTSAYLMSSIGLPPDGWLRQGSILSAALVGCTLGHIFSPWLGFKGGKGIAVAIGCLFIAFGWVAALIELGIFIMLVVITRYVSVGSIAAAIACPFMALWIYRGDWLAVAFGAITGLVIIWAHRDNIRRLLNGSEHRIEKKKASRDEKD